MRRMCFAIRSNAGSTAAAGAFHTRKTVSMPFRHGSSVLGRVRSPRTTSACGGRRTGRVAHHRADVRAGGCQSRENLAANGACPSDNENMIHDEHATGRGPRKSRLWKHLLCKSWETRYPKWISAQGTYQFPDSPGPRASVGPKSAIESESWTVTRSGNLSSRISAAALWTKCKRLPRRLSRYTFLGGREK